MNKIVEILFPNEAHRDFATTQLISEKSIYHVEFSDEKLTPELQTFFKSLMAIKGVDEVSFKRYEIGITVAEAWASDEGWAEISPQVCSLIVDQFYRDEPTPPHEVNDKRPAYERSRREQRDWE